ncbi:MAG TPA: SRPBCC family protein [Moraxellaceae bacterium]
MKVSSSVETEMAAGRERAFLHIVPIPLERIFTGYGPLPAVCGTRDQQGAWDGAGQSRTVLLSDGSTAREQLLAYRAPEYFGYRVGDFSGALGFIARHAEGQWWFEAVGTTRTRVRWQYDFVARSWLAWPLLWLLSRLWRAYMDKALALAARDVERLV